MEDAGGGRCDESAGSPGEVNQALMELGATYCSPNGSGIDDGDPLREFYVSTRLGVAVGRSMRDCGGAAASVGSRIEGLVASEFAISSGEGGGSHCRLCDPGGVSTAYFDIVDKITAAGAAGADAKAKARREDAYAIAGHSSLPIPPPKKSKREEVIAVAVISSRVPDDDDVRCWLMVKRPLEGLLAGKWRDFFLETAHYICIENRAKLSASLRFIPRFQVSGNFHRCASGTRPSRRGGREMKNPESFRLSWFR